MGPAACWLAMRVQSHLSPDWCYMARLCGLLAETNQPGVSENRESLRSSKRMWDHPQNCRARLAGDLAHQTTLPSWRAHQSSPRQTEHRARGRSTCRALQLNRPSSSEVALSRYILQVQKFCFSGLPMPSIRQVKMISTTLHSFPACRCTTALKEMVLIKKGL